MHREEAKQAPPGRNCLAEKLGIHINFLTVNCEQAEEIEERFKISRLPTVAFFRPGFNTDNYHLLSCHDDIPNDSDKVVLDFFLEKVLSTAEFQVLRRGATEKPHQDFEELAVSEDGNSSTTTKKSKKSLLNHFSPSGYYGCRACSLPLYSAKAKYESGCGWPAFEKCYFTSATETSTSGNSTRLPHVSFKHDESFGKSRLEITCARCSSHLGHLFVGHKANINHDKDGSITTAGLTPPAGPGSPKTVDERHCVNSLGLKYFNEDVDAIVNAVLISKGIIEEGGLKAQVSRVVLDSLDDVKYGKSDERNTPITEGIKKST